MDIQLPDFVVAELYKDKLVIIPETQMNTNAADKDKKINPTKTEGSSQEKKFWLGDNKKQVAIIVNDHKNVFIDDNALQFLTNILSACQLNLSDVAIVNIADAQRSFNEITRTLNSKYALLFGIDADKSFLQEKPELFVNTTINNIRIVAAPPLETMMPQTQEAKATKSKLWNALKKMFEI